MNTASLVAALVLMAGVAAGCGDDSASSPATARDNASVEEFCAGVAEIGRSIEGVEGDKPTAEQLDAIQGAAADLGEVGTPEEMSDDARMGLELVVGFIVDSGSATTVDELSSPDDGLAEDEQQQFEAFDSFIEDSCFSPSGDE